jgi:hypothetical protein
VNIVFGFAGRGTFISAPTCKIIKTLSYEIHHFFHKSAVKNTILPQTAKAGRNKKYDEFQSFTSKVHAIGSHE